MNVLVHGRVHACVRLSEDEKACGSEIYISLSLSLSLSLPHLSIPRAEGFDGAAQHDDLLRGLGVYGGPCEAGGSCPPVLHIAQAQVQADGACQQGQQRILLQLVGQDGCVACSPAIVKLISDRVGSVDDD